MNSWHIFQGTDTPHDGVRSLPDPPRWRSLPRSDGTGTGSPPENRPENHKFYVRPDEIHAVNAALYLRRPLLVTGKPGTGKTSLARAVARELKLGPVLKWNITTRTALKDGLYSYDAIGRLQEARARQERGAREEGEKGVKEEKGSLGEIGRYIRLGPLGTALLPSACPRALLVDEIDKSDIDLPNDLLNIFEEGRFEIPELARIQEEVERVAVRTYDGGGRTAEIERGCVACTQFPFVVLTSNGEREFPPAFLRRCVQLQIPEPEEAELQKIASLYLDVETVARAQELIAEFVELRDRGTLATDQLLNAIYLLSGDRVPDEDERKTLKALLLRSLGSVEN